MTQIFYSADSTGEWIDVTKENVCVSEGIVMAKYGSGPAWPALRFWISDKAINHIEGCKGYKKDGELIMRILEFTW